MRFSVSLPLEWSWFFIGLPTLLGHLTFRVRRSRRFYLTAAVTVFIIITLLSHYAVGVSITDGAMDLYIPTPLYLISYPKPVPFRIHVTPQSIEKAFIVDDLYTSQYRLVLRMGRHGAPRLWNREV